jgi:YHS domain-containing protein
MKLTTLILAALTLTIVGCSVETTEKVTQASVDKSPEEPKALPAGFLGNKTCAVSGNQVDPDSFYEHHGEKVYFCCAQCAVEGSKSPDKYRNQVYAQATPVGNTICPVTEEETGTDNVITWQGHEVNVCCSFCVNGFQANPEEFTRAAIASVDG